MNAIPIFEFTVESVGVKPAPELVKEALGLLSQRCHQMKEVVEQAVNK